MCVKASDRSRPEPRSFNRSNLLRLSNALLGESELASFKVNAIWHGGSFGQFGSRQRNDCDVVAAIELLLRDHDYGVLATGEFGPENLTGAHGFQ